MELLFKFLEVAAGASAAIAIWWGSGFKEDFATSLTAGMVITLIIDVARNHHLEGKNAKSIEDKIGALATALTSPRGTSLLTIKAIARSRKKIPREEMDNVWTELSWLVQKKYRATNKISAAKIYGPKHAEAVMTVQKAKVVAQEGVSISKVFIVASESELGEDPLLKIIRHHWNAGIGIKYMTREKLSHFENLAKKAKKLVSEDFAIFDDEVVLIWYVDDKSRDYTGGEVLYGTEESEKYIDYYKDLQCEASDEFTKFLA